MMIIDWKMNMYTFPLTVFNNCEVIQKVQETSHTILSYGPVLLVYIHAQALVLALFPLHRHSG